MGEAVQCREGASLTPDTDPRGVVHRHRFQGSTSLETSCVRDRPLSYNGSRMKAAYAQPRQTLPRQSLAPLLVSRRGYVSTVLNLLIFGLVAVAAMWIVHQIEYEIEYGSRFGLIMASTPHRLYMLPLGVVLGLLFVILAILIAVNLLRARVAVLQLLPGIPSRLRRHAATPGLTVPIGPLLRTAATLAVAQMTLYSVQENLESLTAGWGLPGLGVLLAPRHATVVPLHLLAALCGAILLWTVSLLLHRMRHTLRLARVLAGIGGARQSVAPRVHVGHHIPNPRLLADRRSLRSPPLAA